VSALAREIESYLRERPHASDTVDGIRRWWLAGRWVDASIPLMSAALDLLVQRLVMKARTQADGSTVYYAAARNDLTRDEERPMSVTLQNLTDKPVWLRLNSGASLSILPNASAPPVPEGEVDGNEKLEKLFEQRVIRRLPGEGEGEEGESADDDSKGERRRGASARRTP
jgi:hypothetical protein